MKRLQAMPFVTGFIFVAVTLLPFPQSVRAEPQNEIRRISVQITKKVGKIGISKILTTPLVGCLAAPELCAQWDMTLREEFQKQIPNVQFIPREDAVRFLAAHGFLNVDAYEGALNIVAADAGAKAVVSENISRQRGHCKLLANLVDPQHLFAVEDYSVGIPCPTSSFKENASLLKDSDADVFLIIPSLHFSGVPDAAAIHPPVCVKCPEPRHSEYARNRQLQGLVHLIITVTENGSVENVKLLSAVDPGLAEASFQTINGWQLKPATDAGGMPISTRVPVEVTFRLLGP